MPVVETQSMMAAAGNGQSTALAADAGGMEHLHLHMRRTHWETKHHADLGPHLQDALDKLDREGWEVVTAFNCGQVPEVILRRPKRSVN